MPMIDAKHLEVRLARNHTEVLASQKLRYKVFVQEFGAKVSRQDQIEKVERDKYDCYCDHLILIDNRTFKSLNLPRVVGTIRLLPCEKAKSEIGFYSAAEYTLDRLICNDKKSLEISRACVDKDYRQGISLHLLWTGLAKYVLSRNINLLFGVASFQGNDVSTISSALTLLSKKYSAPKSLGFRAKEFGYIDMNIVPIRKLDQNKALTQMPS